MSASTRPGQLANLVLIETTGNQAFIFATNKLRENVGASELTARVGTRFVLDAIHAAGGPNLSGDTVPQIRSHLRDSAFNRPVNDSNPVEVILAVSGKALLLARDAAIGRRIVQRVTLQALKEAPGLEVRGVVSEAFDLDRDDLHGEIRKVHRQFESVRSRLSGPAARFQRLPIIADCATSGLPATRPANQRDGLAKEERKEYSSQTFAKLNVRQSWKKRVDDIREHHQVKLPLPDATTELEDLGCDWTAIVHADGNGLGQVFLNFKEVSKATNNRDYIDKLRRFSLALDECTEKAFCQALSVFLPKRGVAPIVPLVLGGDDLTVVCDGRQALQFTKKFIDSFEEATSQHNNVKAILADGVTSCAGVTIVKPHFPFFAGYQLAEELLKSAKTFKPRSAIDYHILYDASGPDLERIRSELTVDNGKTLLVGRPYVTTVGQGPVNRRWSDLICRINAVRARDDVEQRRRLPNSMLHELRESLFLGSDTADSRLHLVLERYRNQGLDQLCGSTAGRDSLFWNDDEQHFTGLLDAVDTAEFWEAEG